MLFIVMNPYALMHNCSHMVSVNVRVTCHVHLFPFFQDQSNSDCVKLAACCSYVNNNYKIHNVVAAANVCIFASFLQQSDSSNGTYSVDKIFYKPLCQNHKCNEL